MKNITLSTIITLLSLIGCKHKNSISAQPLHLIEPGNLQNSKSDILCQFKGDKVEIYYFKDRFKRTADVSVGSFLIAGDKLIFPKGTFHIMKIGDNYRLTSNGQLRYLLLTDTAYNSFMSKLSNVKMQLTLVVTICYVYSQDCNYVYSFVK